VTEWPPIRHVWEREDQDRSTEQMNAQREHLMEAGEEIQATAGGPIPAERGVEAHWAEPVSTEQFVGALRTLADALAQGQGFHFAVDHRFVAMLPTGQPSIEYEERANQRKVVTLRYSWES
jgi:hypothetical protein